MGCFYAFGFALRFSWQMTLGAIDDNKMIYQMGTEIARQCSVLGSYHYPVLMLIQIH